MLGDQLYAQSQLSRKRQVLRFAYARETGNGMARGGHVPYFGQWLTRKIIPRDSCAFVCAKSHF
jgi:hypothetical protein